MRYVLATPPDLRGRLLEYPRLYAFPAEPEPVPPDGFLILDSGAFGLSQRGQQIGPEHMRRLAAHYQRHGAGADFPVLAIAPDVYLDPAATLRNWTVWHERGYPPVVPVIQFRRERQIDLWSVRQQVSVYAPGRPPVVAVSNPGLRALRAGGLRAALDLVRERTGAGWLHLLGAGWSPEDLRAWQAVGGFESLDSVAYYTAAQAGEAWDDGPVAASWRDLAIRNARCAGRLFPRVTTKTQRTRRTHKG